MTKPCTIEGCERRLVAKGLCSTHYTRLKMTDTTDDPVRRKATCAIDDCDRTSWARSLCAMHYQRLRTKGSVTLAPRSRRACEVEGCDRPYKARGLCNAHWIQSRRGLALVPLTRSFRPRGKKECTVVGCARYRQSFGLCALHRSRVRAGLALSGPPPAQERLVDSHGYVRLRRGGRLEHRVVMEAHLGRKLLRHENVHHINGDRADNRLENLELWNTSQPAGQRVEDKVRWAEEILALYGPSVRIAEKVA